MQPFLIIGYDLVTSTVFLHVVLKVYAVVCRYSHPLRPPTLDQVYYHRCNREGTEGETAALEPGWNSLELNRGDQRETKCLV